MDRAWAGLRIGDADRQEAVDLLGEQYALGRLTSEELEERSDAAWSARTHGDLAPLFADLPVGRARPAAAAAPVTRPVTRPVPAWRGVGRYVVPVLVVLVALSVLTHLPLVLLAVAVWFLLNRRHPGHRAWGHGHAGSGHRDRSGWARP